MKRKSIVSLALIILFVTSVFSASEVLGTQTARNPVARGIVHASSWDGEVYAPGLGSSYTPVGVNVTVTPAEGVNITFTEVTSAGVTTVNITDTGPPPPPGGVPGPYYDIQTSANFTGKVTIAIVYNGTGLTPEQENALQMVQWNGFWPGDVTGPAGVPDGKVDIRDIALIAKYFGQYVPPAPIICDINSDGKVNIIDIAMAAKNYGKISWITVTIGIDTVRNIIYGQANHLSIFTTH